MGGFLAELRRRQVLRVLGFYAITVWVIVQVAADTFEPLGIPQGVHTALVIALMLGFPVVSVLSWVFDITPQGIVRTAPAEHEVRLNEFGEAISERPRLWIDALIITVLLGIVAYLLIPGTSPVDPESGAASIAVLPFVDLSEARDHEYFADGITEEIITALARNTDLDVASATSAFAFKGSRPDIRAVGRNLGVATVLEGSVRQSADGRLKVTAQLIDARSNFHLWAETYDVTVDRVFEVQDRIARAIVATLDPRSYTDREPLVIAPTLDVGAYDLYLRGLAEMRRSLTRENLDAAIEFFKQALRRDPTYALAEAGLCNAYSQMAHILRGADLRRRAIEACDNARIRNPDLPEVHTSLGWLYLDTGRLDFAREAFETAAALKPADRTAQSDIERGLGLVTYREGDPDTAERYYRRAVELAPDYWRVHASLAAFLYWQGRYEEAVSVSRAGLEHVPGSVELLTNLGGALVTLGHRAEASDVFLTALALRPNAGIFANAGTNFFYMGRYSEARDMYARAVELEPERYEHHGNLANACLRVEDGEDCALSAHRKATEMAENRLQVDPDDVQAWARLAQYRARIGDAGPALEGIGKALELNDQSTNVLTAAAIVYALTGDDDRARAFAERAVAAGYPADLLERHPDLAHLLVAR